jgi:hypothetical protein
MRQALALRGIEAAKMQALAQVRDGEQLLQGHLEALSQYGNRVQELLEQGNDQTFLQVSDLRAVGWDPASLRQAWAHCSCPLGSGVTAAH